MKEINEMSFEELLDLEESIKEAKDKFYDLGELVIVQGHLCTEEVVGNFNFLGSRTPKEIRDIFNGQYIATYYIFSKLTCFKYELDSNNIAYKTKYMRLTEIEEVWEQYKKTEKTTKIYKKIR